MSSLLELVNLISPLFGGEKKKEKKKPIWSYKPEELKKDSYEESVIREYIGKNMVSIFVYKIYDIYKKAHGMAAHDDPYG